jgi:hypothetical protein
VRKAHGLGIAPKSNRSSHKGHLPHLENQPYGQLVHQVSMFALTVNEQQVSSYRSFPPENSAFQIRVFATMLA